MIPNRMRLFVAGATLTGLLAGCNQPADTAATDAAKAPAEAAAPADTSTVLATVNGTDITQNQYDAYARQREQRQPLTGAPGEQEAIVNELVNMELVVQDAMTKGLDKNPEVVQLIDAQRRSLLASAALHDHATKNPVSDEQLKKVYEERIASVSPVELKAAHILVDDEAVAKDIIAQLDKGGDFAKLAKEKSKDSSAAQGGDLGWFNPSQMVPPFAEAAQALEKGTYTKAPVQTQFGWHVIKLEDTRKASIPPFDEMKDRVRAFEQNRMTQEYIQGLRSAATVDMKLPEPPAADTTAPADADPAADAATEAPAEAAPAESAPADAKPAE